ncbi:hypothetical protein AB1207_22215 [Kineococcus endophyticus]|uniref:Adhesin domain-containing protein n=1 Tax=Kineococcus endophyticus TaxID=1181883 RepID=A0ABV3PCU9_9ACTN
MGNTPGNSARSVPFGNRSTWILSLASAGIICALAYGAYEAMTLLPARFVDESSYMTGPVNARVPDRDAIENAYNQARVPIGVTAAALLAATAVAAGVVMNNRTVSLGAATLRQANQKDQDDRKQWSEEQFSKRYQDAATQLGDTSAAVRFAGVYAMVRLAEEWTTHRQVCVDVLCAYLRMPPPKEQQKNSDDERELAAWRAEWEVRRAILQQIELHCRPAEGEQDGAWSSLRYDLSWSTLDGFEMHNAVFKNLSLYGVTTTKGSAVNLVNVRLDDKIDVRQLTIQGGFGVVTSGTADLKLTGLKVAGGAHVNIRHDTPRRDSVRLNEVRLEPGAQLTLHIPPQGVANSVTGRDIRISSNSNVTLYGEKIVQPSGPAIWLRGVRKESDGTISVHHNVIGARLASVEFAQDSPSNNFHQTAVKVIVDTTQPSDHIVRFPVDKLKD